MKLSTRTKYGILAILELAKNYGKGPLPLKTIAQNQGISVKYLEQLMAILRLAGIVKSVRGAKGGYFLAKTPSQIKISDCFNCLEGSMITTRCVDNNSNCPKSPGCAARSLWTEVQDAIMDVLQSITLQSLIDRAKNNKIVNYHI